MGAEKPSKEVVDLLNRRQRGLGKTTLNGPIVIAHGLMRWGSAPWRRLRRRNGTNNSNRTASMSVSKFTTPWTMASEADQRWKEMGEGCCLAYNAVCVLGGPHFLNVSDPLTHFKKPFCTQGGLADVNGLAFIFVVRICKMVVRPWWWGTSRCLVLLSVWPLAIGQNLYRGPSSCAVRHLSSQFNHCADCR